MCWQGDWSVVGTRLDVWSQAAVTRTVGALSELHPFRLGDRKAAPRLVQWVAGQWAPSERPTPDELDTGLGLGVLTVTAHDPDLDRSTTASSPINPSSRWPGAVRAADVLPEGWAGDRVTQWGGALVRLPGTWLPPIALLPRAARGLDDPATSWRTESVDFDHRFTVHTGSVRTAAALLTPAVMAMLLDDVPPNCAVTISGDAVHSWWPYPTAAAAPGQAADVTRATVRLTQAFPPFVLAEHVDASGTIEATLRRRAALARGYRAGRRPGRSPDPVLQRIYDQARAGAGLAPLQDATPPASPTVPATPADGSTP